MSPPSPFRCVVVGADTLLQPCVELLVARGHVLVLIVASSEKTASWARGKGFRVLDAASDWTGELRGAEIDLLFSITHLALLPAAALALPRKLAINFHDGPLPGYAGLNTPAWGLLRREPEWAITWHLMTGAVDEGDILVQTKVELAPEETSLTLNTKCFEAGIEGFEELVRMLEEGTLTRTRQELAGRQSFGRKDRPRCASVLEWTRTAEELEALVRALDFGPYRNPLGAAKIAGARANVLVRRAEVVEIPAGAASTAAAAPAGTVLSAEGAELRVATAYGVLALSGLAAVDGEPLTADAALGHLGTSVGGRLMDLDERIAAAVSELDARCGRTEDFWAGRLARSAPAELPHAGPAASAAAKPDSGVAAIPIHAPAGFFAAHAGAPENELWIAAFGAWLARLGGRDAVDLAYSGPALTRSTDGLGAWFAPRVPLRIEAARTEGFALAVERTSAELARVRANGTYQRDLCTRHPDLAARRDLARPELFDVGVDEPLSPATGGAPIGLLTLRIEGPGRAVFVHDPARMPAGQVRELAQRFEAFLSGLLGLTGLALPGARALGTVELLTPAEKERVLARFNATGRPYRRDACVHDLVLEQVRRTPNAPALSSGPETITYAELERRANRLARRLVQLEIGPDKLVGIALERSIDLVVAVLATHLAGGAYVPLDPHYPRERLRFMVEDAELDALVTTSEHARELGTEALRCVRLDADRERLASLSDAEVDGGARPEHLAYAIYTSGSTGKPKGVLIEHRNVANFFAAMDGAIPHDPPGTWLAVTSLSFDISVLELLWTLTRGFHVVIHRGASHSEAAPAASVASSSVDFGIYFWGNDAGSATATYELLLEAARFADEHGFASVWIPERHFHAFGGAFPNPSVLAAALAAVTKRVQIRAGSVVLPLHHPLRVAEEWAVVDNLSGGRVGISFASGWQPHDFVLRPENFADNKGVMLREIETVRRLWRGEELPFPGPHGDLVPRRTLPRPVQAELPIWITSAGNPDTYRQAAKLGANVLTHLLGQTLEEVAEKIRIYRAALAEHGHDPKRGKVTLMLHTFVGKSDEAVRDLVRGPMKEYLGSSMNLVKQFAWSFPAFKRPPGAAGSAAPDVDLSTLTGEEQEAILEHAFQRYFESSGLFGTVETCLTTIARLQAVGVDEVGCLVDFGLPREQVRAGLDELARLQERSRALAAPTYTPADDGDVLATLAAEARRHGVTHMQCTPSMARMLLGADETRAFLQGLRHLYVGGEAFPVDLAAELTRVQGGSLTNMYGPTETTIWSCTHAVEAPVDGSIPIGKPIANTRIYVLDDAQMPVPPGMLGELWIAGDGVVRGYHRRPELTAERFRPDPFADFVEAASAGAAGLAGPADPACVGGPIAQRMYRTGDVARWRADGVLEFLGRADHQVKLRGHRIELGEIEVALAHHAAVKECVVIAREDTPGDQRLCAYFVARDSSPADAVLREHLRARLPEAWIPAHFVALARLPLTPNGKIDRKALPAPASGASPARTAVAPSGEVETLLAELWRATLGRESVGADDNFFDLGGHSLLVVKLHRDLRQRLSRPVSLTDLYRFPTIRSLAAFLAAGDAGGDDGGASERGSERGRKRRELLERRKSRAGGA